MFREHLANVLSCALCIPLWDFPLSEFMQKRLLLLLMTVLCASQFPLAQVSIHDGTVPSPGSNPDGSSMLDVRASDKGMLVPRVSLAGPSDATTIPTPATSLLVFNLSSSGGLSPGYYYNSGTSGSPAWLRLMSGNATPGTVTSIVTNNGITGGTITTTGTLGLTGQALALHNLGSNGVIVRTAAGTVAARVLTGGNGITISNGDGVSGNPTIAANFGITATTVAAGNHTHSMLTFNSSGVGGTSPITYNGSAAQTISFNTIGATGGSGTADYLARWITTTTLGNGTVRDNGITVGVNMAPNASRMLSSTSATTTADGAALWGNATGAARVYGVFGSISSTTSAAAAVRGNATGTSGDTYGVFGENSSNGVSSAGVRGLATGNNGKGVFGQNSSTGTGSQYGVYGQKSGATGTGTGYGIYGTATGTGTTNYGGYFTASGGNNNYGLVVPSGGGNVGIGTLTPGAKLDIAAGADNTGANDQIALALQYRTGGYRHFMRSRHNNTLTGGGNDIDFYLNNNATTAGSSAPGTGNIHVMTMESFNGTPRVGVGTTAPLQTLHVNGGTVRVSTLAAAGNKVVYADNNGDLILSDIDPEKVPRRDWRPYGTPSYVWDGLTTACSMGLPITARGSATIGTAANYCSSKWGGKWMFTITNLSQEAQINNAAPANGIYLNLPATAGVHNNLLISTIDNDRWSVWSVWLCNSAGTPIVKLARNANNAKNAGSNGSTYTLGPYNNVKETGSHAWVVFPVTKAQVDAQINGGNLRFLLTAGPRNDNATTLYLSGFALVPNPHGFMQHPALPLHFGLSGQAYNEMTWNSVWNNDGLVEIPVNQTKIAYVKVIDPTKDLLVTFHEHNTNWHGGGPTVTVGSNTTVFRPTRGIDGISSKMYATKMYMSPQCIIIPQAIVAAQIVQPASGVPSMIRLNITMSGENKYHFRGIDTEIW